MRSLSERLLEGTDDRATPDPRTGKNAYGGQPSARSVPLASCSASEPDPELCELLAAVPIGSVGSEFAAIRAELGRLLELPVGTRTAIVPSGTDAVYLATALALPPAPRALTSIIVGSGEVGRGTERAARGAHFTRRPPRPGATADPGTPLCGWPTARTHVASVPLRDGAGRPRPLTDVDAHVLAAVAAAEGAGDAVLVHVNAGSKSGLCGPSTQCIDALAKRQVRLLVDAAQGRAAPNDVARWVAQGAMVLYTASKFLGAPPFAGALFVPADFLGAERRAFENLPLGARDYFCDHVLPDREPHAGWENPGLGLRWRLGLLALSRYLALDAASRASVGRAFGAAVARFGTFPSVHLEHPAPTRVEDIVTFGVMRDGRGLDLGEVTAIHAALADAGVMLGAPVVLGDARAALRLSLAAPLATRLAQTSDHGAGWLTDTMNDLGLRLGRLAATGART